MSIRLMSAAFSANIPDVEIPMKDGAHTVKASTSKFVLLALADHANDEGRGAYPALDTLAKKTSMSRRTVQRALDALTQLNIIKCVGVSEYGTDNYTIYEHAIYRGDSGTKAIDGVTLVQEGGDSGALKSVPESPESSFKPSIKPSISNKQIPEIELMFTDVLGRFFGDKERKRWLILSEAVGPARSQELIDWANKKEIHMVNRASLLDSLETAAKKWREPATPKYPNQDKGSRAEFLKQLEAA